MNVSIECICPVKRDGAVRHPDGDTVTLREKLDFRGVTSIRWAVAVLREEDPKAGLPSVLAVLTEGYVLAGVESWTLTEDDEKGKDQPIPVSNTAIREHLLSHDLVAQRVADVADDLYLEVMRPLLNPASTSSPPTPTTESTSPKTGSSGRRPTPLKPSSTSTTPTDGIETTSRSLVGVSSASQSSESAA